jgi:hypothetical protein
MGRLTPAVLALGLCWLTEAHAQEPEQAQPAPELDFLEYLGTWAEEDDEWLVIEEWERANGAEPDEGSEVPKDDDDEGE